MSTARFAVQPLAAVSRASRSHSSSASLRRSKPRRHVAARASLLVQGDLSTTLFALGQQADAAVRLNLESVTPATYALVLVRAQLYLGCASRAAGVGAAHQPVALHAQRAAAPHRLHWR
jgi:hypothetical protein